MNVAEIPDLVRASIAGQTDRGRVREENQGIVHHASTKFGDLLVVADAAGDAAGGSQASRMAVDIISSRVAGMLAFFPPEIALEEAVRQANTELIEASTLPEGRRSCTDVAVVVALLRMDTDRAHVTIGHVGDSRAYLAGKRELTLLTGGASAEPDMQDCKRMTAQPEEPHPDPSTRTPYLGQGLNVKVATSEIELEAGDTLLLCSSGLWRSVSEPEIDRVLANQNQSVEEACHALLELARAAGGHHNVAIEIARLTQNGDSPDKTTHADQNQAVQIQSRALPKITVAPEIEWPAPQPIHYGTALSDAQLNATASVPGTFVYNPGPGAMLSTGEHILSVVFTPSNPSEYAPAQATVPLRVAKATPSISWPAPDPINNTTPIGPAQLNAKASVPGSFVYSPAAGEQPGAGAHTLLVNFTPIDQVNYTPVQASVPLTVIESVPATITWPSPHPVSYGTALGEEQLGARSSVPGSFLYVPAPGDVLPPGEHELSVIFTPEDEVNYAGTRAAVTLIVEELPMVAPLFKEALPSPPASGVGAEPAATDAGESDELPHLFADTREAGDAENEFPISAHDDEGFRSAPLAGEASQEERPLFGMFQSDIEEGRGKKKANKWWTIASVAAAIPLLCVLAFLVDMARSGDPFHKHQTAQPASTAPDAQPQSNSQDPSHQVKITISQTSTGDGTQPPQSSGTGNSKTASTPTAAQTETTGGQPIVSSDTPRGSIQHPEEGAAAPAHSARADAGEPGGRTSAAVGTSEASGRDAASSAVPVSADAAAGQLMESSIPIYPPAAKAAGITGTVELQAIITKDGTVKNVRPVSGPVELRQAAVNCARTWRYRPFLVNNEPTEVQTTINVVFSLTQ